jgi:hypothetical protein
MVFSPAGNSADAAMSQSIVTQALGIDVSVVWGDTVLTRLYRTRPCTLSVGDDPGCDIMLPAEIVGGAAVALASFGGGRVVVLPSSAAARELPAGCTEAVRFGSFRVVVEACAQKANAAAFRRRRAPWPLIAAIAASLGAHASLAAALRASPTAGILDAEVDRGAQIALIRSYLRAGQSDAPDAQVQHGAQESDNYEGGACCKRELGLPASATGHRRRRPAAGSEGVRAGSVDAADFIAAFGKIRGGSAPDHAPVGWLAAPGEHAPGDLWGAGIDGASSSGLGLTGTGEGGGGSGEGIGLASISDLGDGEGLGRGNGIGHGDGFTRGHESRTIRVSFGSCYGHFEQVERDGVVIAHKGEIHECGGVNGRLPPEAVQRIVRANFGRFRDCYEQGLAKSADLAGRVAVRFVIGTEGAVTETSLADADLPDAAVRSCVVQTYRGLAFPKPEGGTVTVIYPIVFSTT